jgi:CelD/BcsL family acetyltransferase involved in cellulose biosynthesis
VTAAAVSLPFRVGARTVWQIDRRLVSISVSLEDGMRANVPDLPTLPPGADGYLIRALPTAALPVLIAARPDLRPFVRQVYHRSYASLEGGFEAYMARFSGRSRSMLKRKRRKLAERSGGALDIRRCQTPQDVDSFHLDARAVSSKSYQERLLGAGLPDGDAARAEMRLRASRDAMRGWLLYVDGIPVSYLYAPADGDTLIYAHLGYDPAYAEFSPGTVLQLEAMRDLMEEGRFRMFDFTEGEGQHKRQFGTGALECADLLLLRPAPGNLLAGHALQAFDGAVALARKITARMGLERLARTLLR